MGVSEMSDWFKKNLTIIIIQGLLTIFTGYIFVASAKRSALIDAKADKKIVELKFKLLEQSINHEKEMRLIFQGNTADDIDEMKRTLSDIDKKIDSMK